MRVLKLLHFDFSVLDFDFKRMEVKTYNVKVVDYPVSASAGFG